MARKRFDPRKDLSKDQKKVLAHNARGAVKDPWSAQNHLRNFERSLPTSASHVAASLVFVQAVEKVLKARIASGAKAAATRAERRAARAA